MNTRDSFAAGLLLACLAVPAVHSQNRTERGRSGDFIALSATADEPVTVRPGGRVHYIIRGRDQDQVGNAANPSNDPLFAIRPVLVRSLKPGTLRLALRSVDRNGTLLYDVSGEASTTAGNYIDTWVAYDGRSASDPRHDSPVAVVQNVRVIADAAEPGTAQLVPAPTVPARRSGRIEHTTRERLSSSLRAEMLRRLPRRQRGLVQGGTIALRALPTALQTQANSYIQRIHSGIVRTAGNAPEVPGSYRLVFQPGTTAIGIDANTVGGGTVHY